MMDRPQDDLPVDARAAKTRLRLYAVGLPLATLIGGWCTLLTLIWIAFPEGAIDHIPIALKSAAAAAAACWLCWLIRTFIRMPALIDDIIERGLSMDGPSRQGGSDRSGKT